MVTDLELMTPVETLNPVELMVGNYLDQLAPYVAEDATFADPALKPLATQVNNHLEQVGYSYRIADGSEDYPFELTENHQPYPAYATRLAVGKAERLLGLIDSTPEDVELSLLTAEYGEKAMAEQNKIAQNLLKDPMAVYEDFAERRRQGGAETAFPELGWTIRSLYYEMVTKASVQSACEASPILNNLRAQLIKDLEAKIEEDKFGYTSSLHMIADATAFFDIAVRVNNADDPELPGLYHSKFEFNWNILTENQELTLLPSMADVNAVDLLKIRGVPVGLIGVTTDIMRVDGQRQTPYEMFMHDVDHTGRLHEANMAAMEREGMTLRRYSQDATDLIFNTILPAIDIEGIDDADERDRRIAMRMIVFEILHEDGYDPSRDTIADAILRAPRENVPRSDLSANGKTIVYSMTPRASVLSHVFRKLTGDFYDFPDRRSSTLGTDLMRTRKMLIQASADLYRLVSDDPVTDEALRATCADFIVSDEAFTPIFARSITEGLKNRSVGGKMLSLMVATPLGPGAAVSYIRREYTKKQGLKIHTLFGFSGMEYEDPKALDELVEAELSQMNPEEVAIAIGATHYGIGRAYSIAKDLGFKTLGIVSQAARADDEESALGVDDIIFVRDNRYGGYRFTNDGGLLAPTTRAFVGASDSITAYGGGNITAVTLKEVERRNEKPWKAHNFDRNHRIADILHAQDGQTGPVDYGSPGYRMAQELLAKRRAN